MTKAHRRMTFLQSESTLIINNQPFDDDHKDSTSPDEHKEFLRTEEANPDEAKVETNQRNGQARKKFLQKPIKNLLVVNLQLEVEI